jgi:DNA replication protein DnaC
MGVDTSRANTGATSSAERRQDKEVCPICKGAGYVTLDVPVHHPDFGKLIPCQCKRKELEEKRRAELRRMSNLGELERMTFDTFLPEGLGLPEDKRRNLRSAYEAAREFAHHPQGWLILMGGYGCGKTHLAAAIANEVIARGEPALFVIVPDLLDHLRATFAPNSPVTFDERFELVRSAPLLILDDLGTQATTPWAQENFARIVPILAGDFRQSGQTLSEALHTNLNSLAQVAEMTFESFSTRDHELTREERENLVNALALARSYAEHPDGWLVFFGDHGTGKTHLAAAIANEQVRRGRPAVFVTVPDLLDYLRAAFGPNSQASFDKRFEEVRRAPFLVLDDLGLESATPWAREKLYQLINFRFNMRLPTVFTMAQRLEDLEPRLRARMLVQTRCTVFALLVPMYTGGGAVQRPRRPRAASSR